MQSDGDESGPIGLIVDLGNHLKNKKKNMIILDECQTFNKTCMFVTT
jgi:hypothetical protein